MQHAHASLDGAGATFTDTCRQRALHGSSRINVQPSGIFSRQCSAFPSSQNASLTAPQGLHQTPRPPRHEHHSTGRGNSLPCHATEASRGVTSRASQSQHWALRTDGVPQHCVVVQRGAIQPGWWQRLSSTAGVCAVAALLAAGGPCSPAEARARLTQVSTSSRTMAT